MHLKHGVDRWRNIIIITRIIVIIMFLDKDNSSNAYQGAVHTIKIKIEPIIRTSNNYFRNFIRAS